MTPEEKRLALRRRQLAARLRAASGGGMTPQQQNAERAAAARAGTLAQPSPERLAQQAKIDQIGADQATLSNVPGWLAGLDKFNQGLPFIGEYRDELTGLVGAGLERIGAVDQGTAARAVASQRATSEAMDRQNPKTSTGLNILGGITGSIPLAIGAAAAAPFAAVSSLAGRVGLGALGGAVGGGIEGAVSGYGAGNDGDRAASARDRGLLGLGIGGVIGGAAPLVAKGLQGIFQRIKGRDVSAIAKELNVSPDAARTVKAFIEADDFDGAAQALARAGDDAMLADAGPSARRLLDTAIQSGGASPRIAREAIEGRAIGANSRLTSVLDATLGKPVGVKAQQKAIRESTKGARKSAYDEAFSVDIDWRSPAGEKLRGLLNTTPEDVLRLAAKNKAMARRAPDVPDSVYAQEFAPSVSVKPGEKSLDFAGRADVDAFFKAYSEVANQKQMKRPFTFTIKKMGGIDPASPAASELKAMGITPQNTPALFKKGGLKDVDNLDASIFPENMRDYGDQTGYADRQSVLDALVGELRGEPIRGVEDEIAARRLADLSKSYGQYEARRAGYAATDAQLAAVPNAPGAVGDIVPMKTVEDIDAIKRALDEIEVTNDGKGKLGGQTQYGLEAGKRAREIRDTLAEISPGYKKALATAADSISRVKGVEFGNSILKPSTSREDVFSFMAKATGGEKKAVAEGMRQYIDESLAQVQRTMGGTETEVGEAMKLVKSLSSRANMQKVKAVLGEARANTLFKALDEAAAQFETRQAVAAGSQTFGRLEGKRMVEEITAPRLRNAATQALNFQPGNAVREIAKLFTTPGKDMQRAKTQELMAEVTRALTEKRGPEAAQALAAMQRAMTLQPLKEAEANALARQVTSALALGSYQTGTQSLAR